MTVHDITIKRQKSYLCLKRGQTVEVTVERRVHYTSYGYKRIKDPSSPKGYRVIFTESKTDDKDREIYTGKLLGFSVDGGSLDSITLETIPRGVQKILIFGKDITDIRVIK